MKTGDIVTIYSDPLEGKIPEGKAKLISKSLTFQSVDNLEYWRVQFLTDEEIVHRLVRSESKRKRD